ncbi:28390_t:CDS:2, partial [Racocetra persica]
EKNQYTTRYKDQLNEVQNNDIINNKSASGAEHTVIERSIIENMKVMNEDIPKDIKFNTWEQVEGFFAKYNKKTFICEFGRKYKAKKDLSVAQKEAQRKIKTKK